MDAEVADDDGFNAMVEWLRDGVVNLGDGDLLELGLAGSMDVEGPCDCAEVWRCGDRWLVRLSRVALFGFPDDAEVMPVDEWVDDPEATDGRLLTGDRALVAEAVVVWFRDRLGVPSIHELGSEHFTFVDEDVDVD